METLTDRQQEVLSYIRSSQQQGRAPSLREIAAHFGFRSMTAARDHVRALEQKGALETAPRQARSLRVTRSDFNPSLSERFLEVPVYGSIPAGFADDRRQEKKGCINVDLQILGIRPTARTFALQVRGDSMIGRHILEGDYVILEHGLTPKNGDVVAALIDNESTLKTFVVDRGRPPFLRAENPKYRDLHAAGELVIQGVMVGLVRKARAQN